MSGEVRRVAIPLPGLHPGQQAVFNAAKRFNAIECGRRWG